MRVVRAEVGPPGKSDLPDEHNGGAMSRHELREAPNAISIVAVGFAALN